MIRKCVEYVLDPVNSSSCSILNIVTQAMKHSFSDWISLPISLTELEEHVLSRCW